MIRRAMCPAYCFGGGCYSAKCRPLAHVPARFMPWLVLPPQNMPACAPASPKRVFKIPYARARDPEINNIYFRGRVRTRVLRARALLWPAGKACLVAASGPVPAWQRAAMARSTGFPPADAASRVRVLAAALASCGEAHFGFSLCWLDGLACSFPVHHCTGGKP